MANRDHITTDTFFDGRIKVYQSLQGYRFSIDAVLLASLPRPKAGEVMLDIGTGCGIIPILLAFRHPGVRLVGVELQAQMASLAEQNVAANQLQDRVTILNADVRRLRGDELPGPVDWVVSNPPYHRTDSGRINPNTERAAARHEIHLNLHELLQITRRFLKTGGRFAVIYPSERLGDLFSGMRGAGIEPKWMQSIHSRKDEDAKLVLIKAIMRGKPGLKVAPPLVIYKADGDYTRTVRQLMSP